jgi:hypothetical protein
MLKSHYEDFNELILQVKEMRGEIQAQQEASKTLKEAEKILKQIKDETAKITNPETKRHAQSKYCNCETSLQEERQHLLKQDKRHIEDSKDYSKDVLKDESKEQERARRNMERFKAMKDIENDVERHHANLEQLKKSTVNVKGVNEEIDKSNRLINKLKPWWR